MNILSLDGIGHQGYAPAFYLNEIDQRLGDKQNIEDCFDLFVGSDGGCVVAMLAAHEDYGAEEILDFFVEFSEGKKSTQDLQNLLPDTELSKLDKEAIIPTLETKRYAPLIFKRSRAQKEAVFDQPVWKIATMAIGRAQTRHIRKHDLEIGADTLKVTSVGHMIGKSDEIALFYGTDKEDIEDINLVSLGVNPQNHISIKPFQVLPDKIMDDYYRVEVKSEHDKRRAFQRQVKDSVNRQEKSINEILSICQDYE